MEKPSPMPWKKNKKIVKTLTPLEEFQFLSPSLGHIGNLQLLKTLKKERKCLSEPWHTVCFTILIYEKKVIIFLFLES